MAWGAFVALWWLTAAPTLVGGPLAAGLVTGSSMTPTFGSGDLVITHRRPEYRIGDVVAAEVRGGLVVHRLVGGDPATGWHTKGDHLDTWDPWTVDQADIRGKVWFVVPGGAAPVVWATRNPVPAALVATLVVGLGAVPWRRRRLDPRLNELVGHAGREQPIDQVGAGSFVALASSFVITVIALAGAAGTAARHSADPRVLVGWTGLALVVGSTMVVLARRIFDGAGLTEPRRSLRRLGYQPLLAITEVPPWIDEVEEVPVLELRSVAERARSPVLHHTSIDGRAHTFVVAGAGEVVAAHVVGDLDVRHAA